jgi:hypothetical protein
LLVGVSAMRHRPAADVAAGTDPRESPTDLVSPAIDPAVPAVVDTAIPANVAQPQQPGAQQLGPVTPEQADVYEIPGDRGPGSVAKASARPHVRQPDRTAPRKATTGTGTPGSGPAIIEQPHY